jgi:hypothetical protein
LGFSNEERIENGSWVYIDEWLFKAHAITPESHKLVRGGLAAALARSIAVFLNDTEILAVKVTLPS